MMDGEMKDRFIRFIISRMDYWISKYSSGGSTIVHRKEIRRDDLWMTSLQTSNSRLHSFNYWYFGLTEQHDGRKSILGTVAIF